MFTVTDATPGTVPTAFSTQPGIRRQPGSRGRQRHVDGDLTVIGDIDAVDQAELVDVRGDLGS